MLEELFAAAENCVVVTEGELDHRDIFRVAALGFPPVEDRHAAQAAIKVTTILLLDMQRHLLWGATAVSRYRLNSGMVTGMPSKTRKRLQL